MPAAKPSENPEKNPSNSGPISGSDPRPIPTATSKRSQAMQSAAIAYIYGDIESKEPEKNLTILSKRYGMGYNHLANCCKGDGWPEFCEELAALERVSRGVARSGELERERGVLASRREIAEIEREVARQRSTIDPLREQARKAIKELRGQTPGTVEHARTLKDLKALREELEAVTGLGDLLGEGRQKRTAIIRAQAEYLAREALDSEQAARNDTAPASGQPHTKGDDSAIIALPAA